MPYDYGKGHGCPSSKPIAVFNKETGKVHGCHENEASAKSQLRALYASVPDASKEADQTALVKEQVAHCAAFLIQDHHPHLADVDMKYSTVAEAAGEHGMFQYAASRVLGDGFEVRVAEDVWMKLNEIQCLALLDHELFHCAIQDGKPFLRPHDVEEFYGVIARYGAWWPGGRRFVMAIQMSPGHIGTDELGGFYGE